MEYVQILRARRILTWYTGFLVVGLVIEAISFYAGRGKNVQDGSLEFSMLAGGAVIAALIIATLTASGLSAEASHTTALIWTRPAERDVIAARFVAVDVAAIALGYVIMLVAMVLGIAIIGGLPLVEFDGARTAREVLLGLGGAMMWYAVISVAASRLPGRGPLLAGLSWGLFPILAGLVFAHNFPVWLHDVIYALNYLNPMAWMGGMTPQRDMSIIPLDVWPRIFGEWAIAIVLLVASVRLWSTREA
ncbi:MAG TPA: hypothetical protein VGC72_03010 [Candidatus Elarobacter sp.]|jgi:hypothetical protein